MFVGIGMNLVRGGASSSPASLFAAAEPGAWYDPSDLTTLFQDSAGTTPVTGPNQPVGRMLDKSGRGNHATQATSTQRPTYGINPITGTRNLLTYTEQFDNAAWVQGESTISANTTVAPNGTTTADTIIPTTVSSTVHRQYYSVSGLTVSSTYTLSIYVKAAGYNWVRIGSGGSYAFFNLTNGTIGNTVSCTPSVTGAGNGWYRCSVAFSATTTSTTLAIFVQTADNQFSAWTGDGTSGLYLWGAQLEQSATATAYQKVVSQYEVTQAGVASASYIAFDGVDDGMVTGTITPNIDKVQVFTGVRKLGSATEGTVVELSASRQLNSGCFTLIAPTVTLDYYNFASKGTSGAFATLASTSPITNILSGIGDISAPNAVLRVNGGAEISTVTTTQGTGNYLAYPLYIGRRGGASNPFNGRLYSLIVRFGANLTTGQITSTESWVNGKTGAY